MIYYGIDPSFTGCAIWCSNDQNLLIATKIDRTENRIISIWEQLNHFIEITNPNKEEFIVGIEGFSFMSKGRAVSQLYGLGWYIRCMMFSKGIKYYEIPPHSWKKYLMREKLSKESKDLLILQTFKRYSREIRDNNLCDAFNIMCFTKRMYEYIKQNEGDKFTKLESDLFDKLLK